MVYEDIAANKRNTFILIFFFVLLIMLLGYIAGELYGDRYLGLGIAGIVAFFSVFTSYFSSDKLVIAATGAKPANPKIHRGLFDAVEGMSLAAGIKMPGVYILHDENINAFATGRNPNHAAVAVTTGALKKLNKLELEGVVAHEMGHIRNYDILISSVSAVLVGTIIIMADIMTRSMLYGRGRRSSRGRGGVVIIIVAILAAILVPIAAQIIQLAISRQREYMADAKAVLLTRYPQGLINALQKIKKDVYEPGQINRGVQHLYLNVPSAIQKRAMFQTHPPIEKRIARLKQM